jgi:V/A-type H+/Na+-transporting ATPase subunit C
VTDDFGYLNARIRIRRGQLLPEGFFSEALKLSFAELVKILGDTIYGPDLTGDSLAEVDRAVAGHLERTVGDLPRLVAGEAREAVVLLLLRSDLANVKMIMRGHRAGLVKEEIKAKLGSGTLSHALYDLLVEAGEAAAMVQILTMTRHPLARALRAAAAESREPLDLEIMLDREFYTAMRRQAQELVQPYLAGFISFEIDALNLATGLKLATMSFAGKSSRFFLAGGRFVTPRFFDLLAHGEMGVMEELEKTDFARVGEARNLASLERGLRCILLDKAHEGVKDVLGAGMAIDYLNRKEWEAGRIRLAARRAFFELPAAAVEPEIFCG